MIHKSVEEKGVRVDKDRAEMAGHSRAVAAREAAHERRHNRIKKSPEQKRFHQANGVASQEIEASGRLFPGTHEEVAAQNKKCWHGKTAKLIEDLQRRVVFGRHRVQAD